MLLLQMPTVVINVEDESAPVIHKEAIQIGARS